MCPNEILQQIFHFYSIFTFEFITSLLVHWEKLLVGYLKVTKVAVIHPNLATGTHQVPIFFVLNAIAYDYMAFQQCWPYMYVVKSLLPIKSLVTSELSLNKSEGQYVPITSQISKENFEVIKRVEIKRIRLWYVLFQFYRIFEFKLILAAELGCLGKFKRSNQILQCAEQQMFHRKCKKIRVSYDTVVMLLVGTSNGCLNLGRKIKIVCLSLSV